MAQRRDRPAVQTSGQTWQVRLPGGKVLEVPSALTSPAAKEEDEPGVIGVNVSFRYEAGSFDRDRVTNVAEQARSLFEGMPGLRFKFFTYDESAGTATNFYVWDSKQAAVEFYSDELRERVTGLYGVPPTIEFVEIAQIVDNSGS